MDFEWIKLKCDKCDESENEYEIRIEEKKKDFIDKVYNNEVTLRCNHGHFLDWKSIQ